jgi:hypothetical protein
MAKYKIEITDNQAARILGALENESIDYEPEFGEYSYARCFIDMAKKLAKAGFYSRQLEIDGFTKEGEYKHGQTK